MKKDVAISKDTVDRICRYISDAVSDGKKVSSLCIEGSQGRWLKAWCYRDATATQSEWWRATIHPNFTIRNHREVMEWIEKGVVSCPSVATFSTKVERRSRITTLPFISCEAILFLARDMQCYTSL